MQKKDSDSKKKKHPGDKKSVLKNTQEVEPDKDQFDFGGLPKGVPFKRNLGCGG